MKALRITLLVVALLVIPAHAAALIYFYNLWIPDFCEGWRTSWAVGFVIAGVIAAIVVLVITWKAERIHKVFKILISIFLPLLELAVIGGWVIGMALEHTSDMPYRVDRFDDKDVYVFIDYRHHDAYSYEAAGFFGLWPHTVDVNEGSSVEFNVCGILWPVEPREIGEGRWHFNQETPFSREPERKGDSVFYTFATPTGSDTSSVFAVDLNTRTGGWIK